MCFYANDKFLGNVTSGFRSKKLIRQTLKAFDKSVYGLAYNGPVYDQPEVKKRIEKAFWQDIEDKLDDLEMPYTVAGGNLSYGENLRNAGRAGSTYSSPKAAIMAILQGCSDIADEVGSSKIYAAWHGEDITYIESPYSHMSITDFHNNIISIRNAYMGGIEGQRDESLSVHNYVNKGNPMIDAKIIQAIDEALSKIDAMPAPFVEHYSDAANGAAVKACAELSDAIGEAIDMIRNL